MRALRLVAALFVALTAAFFPLLIASPATAVEPLYTLAEYNSALTAAQTAVTNAQDEVAVAQAAVDASAVYHETVTVTGQSNVVVNGTFDDASGWSNIGMGSNSTITNSSIPRVYNGVLVGSYVYSVYVQQTGTFATPTRNVVFSYDMSNNNFNDGNRPQIDQYRVEFRTYSANGTRLNYYDTRDRADTFPWTHFEETYTLPEDAVRWDIGFRMSDSGYWNGNFAGSIDNVRLVAATSSVTPAYTSYDQALVNTLAQKKAALVTAQAALAAIPALSIDAPTNLTGTVDGSTVTLSWSGPTSHLVPERYAISWTDGTGGWGISSTTTSSTIDASIIGSTGGWDKNYTFKIRSDQDTAQMYSAWSNEVTLYLAAPAVPVSEPSPSETPSATSSPSPSPDSPSPTPEPSSPEPSPEASQPSTPEPSPTPTPEITPQPNPTSNPPSNTVMGIVGEGGLLQLVAPVTKIFTSIIFASYGTPNNYQIDANCHAESSMQKVIEFVLGRQIAEIAADNGVFGDPCGGTVKQLAVIAAYGDASPSPSTSDSATVVSPSPSPEPSAPAPESSPSPSPTPEPSIEPVPQPTVTPQPPVEPRPEPSPSPTPTSPEPSPSPSPEPEPSPEPTVSPDPEPEETPEPSPTPSPEETPTPEPSPTPEPEPSSSASPEPEPTPTDNASEPPVVEEKPITEEEKAEVGLALVAALAPGEALSAEAIKEAGITYADLPPATPVEVRTDAEGNPVIITAEVADALTLVENPAELVGALFTDPAKALLALGSLGADMSPEEREDAQKAVVAAVVVGQLAANAAAGVAMTQRRVG